jgi:hypothetical protein
MPAVLTSTRQSVVRLAWILNGPLWHIIGVYSGCAAVFARRALGFTDSKLFDRAGRWGKERVLR